MRKSGGVGWSDGSYARYPHLYICSSNRPTPLIPVPEVSTISQPIVLAFDVLLSVAKIAAKGDGICFVLNSLN